VEFDPKKVQHVSSKADFDEIKSLEPGAVLLFFGSFPSIDALIFSADKSLYLIQISKSGYAAHRKFGDLNKPTKDQYLPSVLKYVMKKAGFDIPMSRTVTKLPANVVPVYLTTDTATTYAGETQDNKVFEESVHYVNRAHLLEMNFGWNSYPETYALLKDGSNMF
jgi:hypothetical protein